MLPSIAIGTSQHIDVVRCNLHKQLSNLADNGLNFKITELPAGKYTFLSCCIDNNCSKSSEDKALKKYVASALSDVIINQWQNMLITKIIRENYYYFNEEDRSKIYQFTQEYVDKRVEPSGALLHKRRREQIYQQIQDYLESNNELIIEGFIRFRLKEYVSELKEAIDNAVDDFLMEREYSEFIQLLRYFVDIQDSKIDLAHVVAKPNGNFSLYDKNKKSINNDNMEEFILDINSDISYEDLLISALISLSPHKIVFHHNENKLPQNTLKTIKDVFVDRVETCNGCELCQKMIK